MSFDVITFGSAIIDIFLKSADFKVIDQEKKFICQGYGEKINLDKKEISLGGGGTNSAVCFSRHGLKVGVCCRFGKGPFGSFVVNELEKEGVNKKFFVQKDEPTDTSVIIIGPDGERTILIYRGNTRLEKGNIYWEKLSTDWFYITSLEGNLQLAEDLINFAGENKIKVGWNPGKKELADKNKIKQLISQVEVFNLNRDEMEGLIELEFNDRSFWNEVGSLNAPLTVVTDGSKGAYLVEEGESKPYFLSAPEVDTVDVTGAGDAFGSGFVVGLIKGMDKKTAFELAMKNASSVVQHIGAKKGLIYN
jgi:ribokinase